MRRVAWFLLVPLLCFSAFAAPTTVSFDAHFSGPGQDIHDRSLADAAATFVNTFTDWGGGFTSWAGFAFSTVSNTTDGSWGNQYAAAAACPNAYAVAYHDSWNPAPEILFDLPCAPQSVRLNNTTYAAESIRLGTAYNRAFTNGDFFVLTLAARNLDGAVVAATNHYLADFRGTNRFIQTHWTELDLSWMPPEAVSLAGTLETTDMGAFGPNTPTYFALAGFTYAYGGLDSGIDATNPAILCLAAGVADYTPGPNVSNQFRTATNALGSVDLGDGTYDPFGIVSLGDGGSLTLTFPAPVSDGPGPDFAVFENAFDARFLELAFAEVSSDGTNFTRFPAHALATNPVQPYATNIYMEAEDYGGLAGKHLQGTGTPFDLRTLAGTPGLDLHRVTHVRLVDIPGDGSVTDGYGHAIYDPYPTIGSGGFDVDGVAALHVNLDIAADPDAAPPALPGWQTVLDYKAALAAPEWTANAPARGTPGFFRWRLVKE